MDASTCMCVPLWYSALDIIVIDAAMFSHCEPLSAFTVVVWARVAKLKGASTVVTEDREYFAPRFSHPVSSSAGR